MTLCALVGYQWTFSHRHPLPVIGLLAFMMLAIIEVAAAEDAVGPKAEVQFGGQCT